MASSQLYGLPLRPWAISTSQATISVMITTSPDAAVARMSIWANRSSRPSPRSPRTVSLRPASRMARPNTVITARNTRPAPGCPPSQEAVSRRPPMATENSGRNHLVRVNAGLCLIIEHLLHRHPEVPGQGHREGQGRGVPVVLDRVDRLPGHPHRLRQLPLGEAAVQPHRAHPVLHPRPHPIPVACKASLSQTS